MTDADELEALRESIADVLRGEASREILLQHHEHGSGMLRPLWQTATDLGWTGICVPEEHGGIGYGSDALIAVCTELGRVAAPIPFLTTALAAHIVARQGTPDQQAQWLPGIVSGSTAAIAAPAPLGQPMLALAQDGGSLRLSGTVPHILDARDADLLVVLASDENNVLFRVILTKDDTPALTASGAWDHGHTLDSLHCDGLTVPADRAMPTDMAAERSLLALAALGLAAEAVGGSEALIAITADYLRTREQFGRLIGSFQALKHRMADHQAQAVAGRFLLEAATRALVSGAAVGPHEAHAAKALACARYVAFGRDAIQMHGGMGFTAEQPVHLYVKRALLLDSLFGGEGTHIDEAARFVFEGEAA